MTTDFIQSLFTVAILALLTFIIIEMRRDHDLVEKLKNATPWLGWTENDDHETPVTYAHN